MSVEWSEPRSGSTTKLEGSKATGELWNDKNILWKKTFEPKTGAVDSSSKDEETSFDDSFQNSFQDKCLLDVSSL